MLGFSGPVVVVTAGCDLLHDPISKYSYSARTAQAVVAMSWGDRLNFDN